MKKLFNLAYNFGTPVDPIKTEKAIKDMWYTHPSGPGCSITMGGSTTTELFVEKPVSQNKPHEVPDDIDGFSCGRTNFEKSKHS